ncbi:hypothetical protein SDC9_165392 [bioreactor metagenome]|uniref:Uncharacterized protein n=1 Tax=bioreactor metagenome TaxID=1076179 RepID=A0A645G1M0_9ZZZZ
MIRHFFHAIGYHEASEVPRACFAFASSNHQLATAFQHVSTHIVDVRTRHTARASDYNIISRIRSITASAVCAQQVIPAVAIHQSGSFAVDGNVDFLIALYALAGLWIKFHNANESEIGAVGQPEPSVRWVEQ